MTLTTKYGKNGIEYYIDGVPATKKQVDKRFPSKLKQMVAARKTPDGHRPSCWPMTGVLTGVDVSEIADAKAEAAKAGLRIDFCEKTGGVIWESAAHKKKYVEHMKQIDRGSMYG